MILLLRLLNERVVLPEHHVESLAVCMPHMDKQCFNSKANHLSLDAERQRVQCAWALNVHSDWTRRRQFDGAKHDAMFLEQL